MNEIVLNSGSGKFIYCYNEYAYLLSYLFGYKILDGCRCGFPDNALDKILFGFEKKSINYKLLGKNMSVLKHIEFEENNFLKIMEECNTYFEKLKIINDINEKLWEMDVKKIESINSELLQNRS